VKELLLEILACPVCKDGLELRDAVKEDVEIVTGTLYCAHCRVSYPIEDGIPNLLPPDAR
jgi:uncharacterized protein YbaR (Trm112 family)